MSVADKSSKRVLVAGASGYIGKFVVRECVKRGYETVALVRPGYRDNAEALKGASLLYCDVTNEQTLRAQVFCTPADVVISCLASRSGTEDDSHLIDYQATLNVLNAAKAAAQLDQFILLSAFCVRKPELQFQKAKLKFEVALQSAHQRGEVNKYSIVRPTAFFKSVSGQFELIQKVLRSLTPLQCRVTFAFMIW